MKFILILILFYTINYTYSHGITKNSLQSSSTFETQAKDLYFIENKGQFTDKNNLAENIFFKLSLSGLNIWLTNEGLVFQSFTSEEEKRDDGEYKMDGSDFPNSVQYKWYRTNIKPIQSKISKENIFFDSIKNRKIDYYYAQNPNGIKEVGITKEILIKQIYPGIDWKIYIENAGLKHEFVVHQGYDYRQIKLDYEGYGSFEADSNQIFIQNPSGILHEGKLLCYSGNDTLRSKMLYQNVSQSNSFENSNAKESKTQNEGNKFHYSISYEIQYTKKLHEPIIIDPPLTWATLMGGNGSDFAWSVYADNNFLWMGGYTTSLNFPTLNAGGNFFQGASTGDLDIVFSQFDIVTNELLWATYYGGDDFDVCASIQSDGTSVWLTGQAVSTNFPTFNAGGTSYFQANSLGGNNAYILQFDIATRNRIWATYLGGSGSDLGWEILNDGNNLWLVGESTSNDFPTMNISGSGFFKPNLNGFSDIFISKFNTASKALEWSTYFGGNMGEIARDIKISPNYIWVGGFTSSSDFLTLNTGGSAYFQNTLLGTEDGFVIKFDRQDHSLLYATYFGGSGSDVINSLSLNGNELYATGTSNSPNMPTQNFGGNAFFQGTLGGGIDNFIIQLNNNSNALEWGTYFGGSAGDMSQYVVTDNNSIWCHGFTSSSNFPVVLTDSCSFFQGVYGGGSSDAFIVKFDRFTKELGYSTYYGGNGGDLGVSIFSNNNSIWFSGQEGSSNFLTQSSNSNDFFQSQLFGTNDAYILKFSECTQSGVNPIIASVVASPNLVCSTQPAMVSLVVNGNLNSANRWVWFADSCGGIPIGIGDSIIVLIDSSTTYYVRGEGCCLNGVQACQSVNVQFSSSDIFVDSITICSGDTLILQNGQMVSQAGIFSDTLLNTTGCDSIIMFNVTMLLSVTKDTFITICSGDSVFVNGVYHTTTGIYSDTVLNGALSGCDSIINFNINVSSNIDPSILPFNPPLCGDTNTIQLSAVSPGGIWIGKGIQDNILGIFSPLLAGMGIDTIIYLFPGSCGISDTALIEVLPEIMISSIINTESCFGQLDGSIVLAATGGTGVLTFAWSNGDSTPSIMNLAPDNYTVTITDDAGCELIQIYSISTGAICCSLSAVVNSSNTLCNANVGSITVNFDSLSGTPPFQFSIDNGANFSPNNNFNNLAASTYFVMMRDANNCEFKDTITIVETNNSIVLSSSVQNISCFGFSDGSIAVSAMGDNPPFSFLWNMGSTLDHVDSLIAGNYFLTVSDVSGCERILDFIIIEPPLFVVDLGNDTTICEGETIILDAGSGNKFEWSTSDTTQTKTISTTQIVSVFVVDSNGCSATDTINITQNQIEVEIVADTNIIFDLDTVQLTGIVTSSNSSTGIFQWSPTQNLSCTDCPNPLAFPKETTLFQLLYTDEEGCSVSDSFQMLVLPLNFNFFMPNAFSPNGDGVNDILFPITNGMKQISWRIFTRWGEKVFECINSTEPCVWNGVFKGKVLDSNVFVWEAVVEFKEPSIRRYKGSLTLLK